MCRKRFADGHGDLTTPEALSCGAGKDVAERLEKVLVPDDCEQIGFVHPKITVRIANSVTLGASTLTVPVPNLCYDTCRLTTDVIAGGSRIARQEVRLRGSSNGRATFVLSAAQRRAISRAGQVTLHYVPPQDAVTWVRASPQRIADVRR